MQRTKTHKYSLKTTGYVEEDPNANQWLTPGTYFLENLDGSIVSTLHQRVPSIRMGERFFKNHSLKLQSKHCNKLPD
jgi:hypothetical protein